MIIRTTAKFETAHRQLNDPSKCGRLHGHNWKADISIECHELGPLGYIIDFKDIKDIFSKYDHTVVLNPDDPLVDVLTSMNQKVVTVDGNPTCEVLCKQFYKDIQRLCMNLTHVKISIVLYENEDSYARIEN